MQLLPVTMVKEFVWCAAIPWIIHNYGIEPPLTPSMKQGIDFQKSLSRNNVVEELGLEPPIEYQVYVEDRELGICGVIDILAGSKRKKIVEVKAFRRNIRKCEHFKMQLYTYALIAYRKRMPVEKAILLLEKNKYEFTITKEKLDQAKKTVEKLWKTIQSPEPPKIQQDEKKCEYCRYKRICPIYVV